MSTRGRSDCERILFPIPAANRDTILNMPVDVILNAIVAAISSGVVAESTEVGKKAIADAYDGVKSIIKRRFGGQSEAAAALEKLEAKPASVGRQQVLSEELETSGAASDPELIEAAQALLVLIHSLPRGEKHTQIAVGSGIAQADGGSTATVNWSPGPREDA